jgi:site-specific recombinase XerD
VLLFHRWLGEIGRSLSDLTVSDMTTFLEQPSRSSISRVTRYNYRYELRKYLRWLEERGLVGLFEKAELVGYRQNRKPLPDEVCRFLRYLAPTHRRSTVEGYRSTLRQFHEWLAAQNLELRHVDRSICLRWAQHLHDRGLHPASRVGHLVSLRKYLDWLWEHEIVATPGTALLRAADLPKKPEYLPRPLPPEADRVLQERLKASESDAGLGLYIMRRAGLRVGELRRLERDCVRDDHNGRHFLKVPLGKLNTERLVPLDAASLEIVTKLQSVVDESSPWLLQGVRGRPISATTYQSTLRQIAAGLKVGERLTTHRLRHSFATSLMNGGMSLMGIMKLLGHRDYRMTLRYTAIADETVGREYFEALSRVAERYDLLTAEPELAQRAFDPLIALQDVVRWVETTLRARAEEERDASLVHDTVLVVRRIDSAREALEAVKTAIEGRAGNC